LCTCATARSAGGKSRLWSFTFDDMAAPERGGTARWLLDGTEDHTMLDNIGINARGVVVLTEDEGGAYNNRVLQYAPAAANRTRFLLQHAPQFDEFNCEASGVVDVSHIIGAGWFLLTTQIHGSGALVDAGVIEQSQLMAMRVDGAQAEADSAPLVYRVLLNGVDVTSSDGEPIELAVDKPLDIDVRLLNTAAAGGVGAWQAKLSVDEATIDVEAELLDAAMPPASATFVPPLRAQIRATHRFGAAASGGERRVQLEAGGVTTLLATLRIVERAERTQQPLPSLDVASTEPLAADSIAMIVVFVVLLIVALIVSLLLVTRSRSSTD
jgi:hypothetical protein